MREDIRTALHQRAEQVTAALIRLESDSMQGHEGAVADWILQFFETAGIQAEKQECAPGRYNVIAELPGRRSDRTILFSGHRGVMAFTAEFFGKSAHVGQAALGVNAIDGALCAAEKIRRLEQALSQRTQEYLGSPSIFTTQISGGKKVNVIPDYAQIRVDRRLIAGETPESYTAQMQKILDETARETGCRTKLTVTTSCQPGLSRPAAARADRCGRTAAGAEAERHAGDLRRIVRDGNAAGGAWRSGGDPWAREH